MSKSAGTSYRRANPNLLDWADSCVLKLFVYQGKQTFRTLSCEVGAASDEKGTLESPHNHPGPKAERAFLECDSSKGPMGAEFVEDGIRGKKGTLGQNDHRPRL